MDSSWFYVCIGAYFGLRLRSPSRSEVLMLHWPFLSSEESKMQSAGMLELLERFIISPTLRSDDFISIVESSLFSLVYTFWMSILFTYLSFCHLRKSAINSPSIPTIILQATGIKLAKGLFVAMESLVWSTPLKMKNRCITFFNWWKIVKGRKVNTEYFVVFIKFLGKSWGKNSTD